MSLYRQYRPQTFSEIVDQDQVVKPLVAQLTSGKITHAYLFSGPRGTGKTSTARIFAKAVNCEKHKDDKFGEPCNKCNTCTSITTGRNFDVIELDAASNRGIDEIRDLREKVNLAPASSRYKVYIIDEAHQLTNEAFNALLKTLEEPPAHAIFILATTEVHKIPATIASRTQKYEFQLSSKTIDKYSKFPEAKNLPKESLQLIAKYSGGSFRDGEVLLEKVVTTNPKATPEEVEQILGLSSAKTLSLFEKVLEKNVRDSVLWLQSYSGDFKVLGENLLESLRDIMLIKIGVLTKVSPKYPANEFAELENFGNLLAAKRLQTWLELFTEATATIKDSPIPSLPLELAIIEACEFGDEPESNPKPTNDTVVKVEKTIVEVSQEVGDKIEKAEVFETKEPKEAKLRKQVSIEIEDVKKGWTEILSKVRSQNNSLGVFLRNAKPLEFEEGLLALEVYYQFHKDLLDEPKNSRLISAVIEETLGKPVRIIGKVGIRAEKPKEPKVEIPEETDPAELFGKLN